MLHFNLNGQLYPENELVLSVKNRAFRYGDALFESMHANGMQVYFFEKHFARLTTGMKMLKMEIPYTFSKVFLENEIEGTLHKNRLFQGARVRLMIFRNGGGLYTPETNKISYLIEVEKLETDIYDLNTKGLIIDIYKDARVARSSFSSLKTANSLPYILAAIYRDENKLDECVLLNEADELVEGTGSNIFLIWKENLFTPNLSSGCVAGVMRHQILQLAKELNIRIVPDYKLTEKELSACDEVFFTNAVKGIRWAVAYKNKRYFNRFSRLLHNKLIENTIF